MVLFICKLLEICNFDMIVPLLLLFFLGYHNEFLLSHKNNYVNLSSLFKCTWLIFLLTTEWKTRNLPVQISCEPHKYNTCWKRSQKPFCICRFLRLSLNWDLILFSRYCERNWIDNEFWRVSACQAALNTALQHRNKQTTSNALHKHFDCVICLVVFGCHVCIV